MWIWTRALKWTWHIYILYIYFGPKNIFIPPSPFPKMIFFPLSQHVFFRLQLCPFCLDSSLFCIYFSLLIPIFSFSFPFPPLFFHFTPLLFTFLYFFSQMTSAHIFPLPCGEGGGGVFPISCPFPAPMPCPCSCKYGTQVHALSWIHWIVHYRKNTHRKFPFIHNVLSCWQKIKRNNRYVVCLRMKTQY